MLSRITLSLVLMLAVLAAPIAPIEITKAVSPRADRCPAMQMNVDPCQRCPVNSNQTSSNSTCCSVQAPCFVGYAHDSDDFVAGVKAGAFASFANDHVAVRYQRPPVPPPRAAFS